MLKPGELMLSEHVSKLTQSHRKKTPDESVSIPFVNEQIRVPTHQDYERRHTLSLIHLL